MAGKTIGELTTLENPSSSAVIPISADGSTLQKTTFGDVANKYITNCLTEIPQDIKLELNNGTLTLKAGSKVYYPNGFLQDGVTPKYEEIVTTEDYTRTDSTVSSKTTCFYIVDETSILPYQSFSGETAPTFTGQGVWYDTTNNLIKRSVDGGSTWDTVKASFPFALVTNDGTGYKSIDQVFNGFGYIGSTVFALPGVEGLSPNGRNLDGTLKNIKFTVSSVISETRQDYGTNVRALKLGANYISGMAKTNYRYDEINNFNYESNNLRNYAILGELATTNNKIDSFTMPTSFSTLDYSVPHIIETYHNGTDWYRVWSDGWCEQGGRYYNNANVANTINLYKPFINTDYMVLVDRGINGTYNNNINGQHAGEPYDFTTTSFKVNTYAAVGLNTIQWHACGYIS